MRYLRCISSCWKRISGGAGPCASYSVPLQAFLGTEVVKAALNLTGSALAAITGELRGSSFTRADADA